MIVDSYEVRRLNEEKRREKQRESAEKFKAQADADAQNGWNSFLARHSGPRAVRDGIEFFDCSANRDMIELLIDTEELPITLETIEWAWLECRNRLAPFPKQQYERKTNVAESGRNPMQQLRSFAPPDKVAPYMRSELQAMTKSQLQAAVKKYGLRSINAILAGQN
jgi:hypothetical protein